MKTRIQRPTALSRSLFYDAQDDSREVVIPEDLSTLDDEGLASLLVEATEAFQSAYGEGENLTAETVESLGLLADGIDAIKVEQESREERAEELATQAAAIAARVNPPEAQAEEAVAEAAAVVEAEAVVAEAEAATDTVVASGGPRRITVPRGRRSQAPVLLEDNSSSSRIYAGESVPGLSDGQEIDWLGAGRALDRRLRSFNDAPYKNARRTGKRMRTQLSLARIDKGIPNEFMINSEASEHVESVIEHARSQARLPGASLLASGGWCAPSETIYELCELESRDGMVSVPEIGLARGGLQHALGPDFASIYADTGFCYTEAEDIEGDYDGEGGGVKPCFHVECPDFVNDRMGLCGVCITAGLLQARGYPEAIARVIRGSIVAHLHRVNASFIASMVAGSTAITMPTTQVGATAPVLMSIEMQVEHMRHLERMSRTAVIEGVFPYWIRGVIRADLSRRLGVDLLSVTDQMINTWFTQRQIAAQFVYDWQDISTTAASAFTSYPTTVSFLLYPAGTWVKGTSPIIDLDTIYDSTLLGTNDYTALFTEEGFVALKRCHDSRVITVGICPDGATAAGVDIDCDGTLIAA